jgi:hypothetical protein
MEERLPSPEWDEGVQELGGGILQSRLWARFQHELGRRPVWEAGDGWRWLATLRASRGLRYLFCAYGPVARDEPAMNQAILSLRAAGKALGADFVRLEPQANATPVGLCAYGARQIEDVDPAHTQIVDLTHDEARLRAQLASGHRNRINGTARRGITLRYSTDGSDIEEFLKMLEDTARRSGVVFYPAAYYRQLCHTLGPEGALRLYVAAAGGQPVASALFYDWGGTRYYAHAGAYQELNRKVHASVSLMWGAMLDARESGLRRLDLWGVAPEGDSAHRLAALSRFKTSFGGTQVDYAGSWDFPLKPAKYAAYQLYRRLRGRH